MMDDATRSASATVHTEYGPVVGIDGPVRMFRNIPFAAPPVGDLRWRPPEPPAPWTEPRDATQWGPDCPQVYRREVRAPDTSEDCLNLNIWTPAADETAGLPVLVWLYGGSFVGGSGSDPRSDGQRFAEKGVVLVTFNYRVGLFGFLGHPALTAESPDGSSSNYGLLDCLAALGWIKRNIRAFGGDPDKVTVFGCSAGSAAIGLLLTSPLAEGLFDRAILESPGAFRPLAGLADAEAAGRMLGDDLAAMRAMTADEVLARTKDFAPKVRGLTTPRVLRPIRDGWVIPADEADAFAAGAFRRVPVLVGSNSDEGSPFVGDWPVKTVADYRELVAKNFGDRTDEALALYPAADDADVLGAMAGLFGDTQFQYGARRLAREMARVEPRTFRYLFTRSRPGLGRPPYHAEEVEYVFGEPLADDAGDRYDATDAQLADAIMDAWVRFADTGDPNGPGVPDWPPYDPKTDSYMELGDTIRPGAAYRGAQLDFLDDYFGAA